MTRRVLPTVVITLLGALPVLADTKVNRGTTGDQPQVLYVGGEEFAVLFYDNFDYWSIARLDEAGRIAFGPVNVDSDVSHFPTISFFAWSGSRIGWMYDITTGSKSELWFHTIDRDGTMLSTPTLISAGAPSESPCCGDIVWAEGEFLVGWRSDSTAAYQVGFRRVAETGQPASPEYLVTTALNGGQLHVGRLGSVLMASFRVSSPQDSVQATWLDDQGNVLVPPVDLVPPRPGYSFFVEDILVMSDRFALFYTPFKSPTKRSVEYIQVDAAGQILAGPAVMNAGIGSVGTQKPALGAGGFGIACEHAEPTDLSGRIYLRRASDDASLVSKVINVSDGPNASGYSAAYPHVDYHDRVYGVAYEDNRDAPSSDDAYFDVAPGYELLMTGDGPSPSSTPEIKLFQPEQIAGAPLTAIAPYQAGGYGANVGAGDIDGDGTDEVLSGPGPGSVYRPQVRAFTYQGIAKQKVNFYAYGTLKYGVNVAGSRLDSDAFYELLTTPGPGAVFGPHVRGFNFDNATIQPVQKVSFFAYSTLKYGARVASTNLDSDATWEVLTGPGPGQVFGSQLRGFNYDGSAVTSIPAINAIIYGASAYGLEVAGGDTDLDLFGEIACAAGPSPGNDSSIAVYDFDGSALSEKSGSRFVAFPGALGGAHVQFCQWMDGDVNRELLISKGPLPANDSQVIVRDDSAASFTPLATFDPYPAQSHGATLGSVFVGF